MVWRKVLGLPIAKEPRHVHPRAAGCPVGPDHRLVHPRRPAAAQHGQAWSGLAALKGKYFADKPASRVLVPVLKKLLGKHYAAFDPGARQASAFRPGKDSADTVGVLWAVSAASAAVRCIGG